MGYGIKETLLAAVKTAVSRYGVDGVSTRNIAEIAKVNDANIYRFFASRDDLLHASFVNTEDEIFRLLLDCIDRLVGNEKGLHLKDCARITFLKFWKMLLEDPELCRFHDFYVHSLAFEKNSMDYYRDQVETLAGRLEWLFWSEEEAIRTMEYILTILYGSARRVADGRIPDGDETANAVFEDAFSILYTHSNRWPFREVVRMQNQ